MNKPFLSIDQQIELLNARGVITDEKMYNILLSEGYYSLINGYKEPFVDNCKSGDVYKEGTHFDHIYQLFLFDRKIARDNISLFD